ncbi:MAG: hypothetical protein ABL928_16400 [Sphingorhabdus sp.]
MFLLAAVALATPVPKSDAQIEYEALLPIAMVNYRTCLTLKTDYYAKTEETVATVVDAAFGACSEDRATLSALPKKVGLNVSVESHERQLAWIDEQERKRLTPFVIDLRTK